MLNADTVTLNAPIESVGLPLFLQVKTRLEEEISAGRLVGGDKLPSERVLCERFGVSRVTMRKALAALAEAESIEARGGVRGWFVAQPGRLSDPPNTLVGFSEIASARGLRATSRVLEAELRLAASSEADALGVAPGAPVFSLRRVRLLNGQPVALDHSVLASSLAERLVGVDFEQESLYEFLERECGASPTRAEYLVEAGLPSAEVIEHLGLSPADPVIVLSTVTSDQTLRVIEVGKITYPANIYRFRATMFRTTQG